jgi:hypothetical protein
MVATKKQTSSPVCDMKPRGEDMKQRGKKKMSDFISEVMIYREANV